MSENQEAGSPGRKLTNREEQNQRQREAALKANAINDVLREMGLFGNYTPKGENPASFPIQIMSEAQSLIGMREYNTGHKKDLGDKLAPYKSALKSVEMAYEIISYPILEDTRDGLSIRELIDDAEEHPLENTEEFPHRRPIELNDVEEVPFRNLLTSHKP